MARSNSRTTPADTAALFAMIVLIAAVLVLSGIYYLRLNGYFQSDAAAAENTVPNVIETEENAAAETTATVTTVSETSMPAVTSSETTVISESETEETSDTDATSNPAIPAPTEYDKEFYDNVLMIGDSLSVGFVNYGYLKKENVFAQLGLTPASVMTTDIDEQSVYDKAVELSPEYICIMLGTNGLSYLSEDYMADKMGEFIDALAGICPDAEIAVISIPPVTAEHEEEKPEKLINISMYNAHIKRVADEKTVKFVDTYSLLQGITGYLADDYAENDGLHFKAAAYPVILSAIQTAFIGDETVTESTAETVTVWEPGTSTSIPPVQTEETETGITIVV